MRIIKHYCNFVLFDLIRAVEVGTWKVRLWIWLYLSPILTLNLKKSKWMKSQSICLFTEFNFQLFRVKFEKSNFHDYSQIESGAVKITKIGYRFYSCVFWHTYLLYFRNKVMITDKWMLWLKVYIIQ